MAKSTTPKKQIIEKPINIDKAYKLKPVLENQLKKQAKEREKKVLPTIIEELNNTIALHIHEINIKAISVPVSGYFRDNYYQVRHLMDELYPEFSFSHSSYNPYSMNIKLSNKDWDHLGYGIKEPLRNNFTEKEHKKGFFHKLFN